MINSVCGIGSTGRMCSDIAGYLSELGHECKIAYGRDSLVPNECTRYAVRIGNNVSVRLHALSSRVLDNAGFESKRATLKFIEWIKQYDPDVIHLHNLHGYYINIEILFNYLRKCNKRIVWTLHDCWAFTGHCTNFEANECKKWMTQCKKCPNRKAYPKSLIIDNSYINYLKKKEMFTGIDNLTIATPSNWLKEIVRESYLKDYPIKVINNGIDTEIFKPTESDFRERHGLADKKILLGVANVWTKAKGFDDFIRLSNMIEDNTRIVLVGVNNRQMHQLPNNIIGIRKTHSAVELAAIYSAADLFINLTYEDNYPTVILEAQACGTPVVTYNTGGSSESVPKENVIASLEEILDLIKYGNNKVYVVDFSKELAFNKYIREYKKKR